LQNCDRRKKKHSYFQTFARDTKKKYADISYYIINSQVASAQELVVTTKLKNFFKNVNRVSIQENII
jgi:hypothetical protein